MKVEGKTQDWSTFPDHSEVWIYQSDRQLTKSEISEIEKACDLFIDKWNTHGKALTAGFQIKYDRFIVVIADPDNSPSGCSKDSMVHFVQSIGSKYTIDFFNRMQVLYRGADHEIKECNLQELSLLAENGSIHDDTIVFNNLTERKDAFDQNWETRLANSWHKQFLN